MDTVLIVDDSSFIVEGLIAFLKKSYRTLAAYGGAECLEILKTETPAVIILDIMMEPMDGWETLSRIKENPETRHVPVLMFSAKKISPEEAERHRISIDDFITKPVSPKKIIEAIEKVIARRETNRLVVERWQAAGIPQEKIDEYLSLATSLEVDLSLCQNMRLQFDLAPHAADEQEEFRGVITAIGERILHERDLIGQISREMNAIAEREESSARPAAQDTIPGKRDVSPQSAGIAVESAIGSGEQESSPDPFTPVPESPPAGAGPAEPPGMEPARGIGAADAETEEMVPSPDGPPLLPVQIPEADPAGEPAPVSEPDTPDGSLPQTAGAPAEGPPLPPPADGSGERKPSGPATPAGPGPAGSPSPTPPQPDGGLPDVTARKVIPANIDLPPKTPAGSSVHGGGTDVPMPWDIDRERKVQKANPAAGKKALPGQPGTASRAPGILGRILSIVQSLFGGRR